MRFKLFLVLVVILNFFSCKEEESFSDVSIAVHAVSGLYNPGSFFVDNTLEAMNYALQFEELDGIEIDVQFSADGSIWMFHDEYLDDRTNQNGKVCGKMDEVLGQTNYTGLVTPSLAKLSSVDWSEINGNKNIYLDVKIFSCGDTQTPYSSILIQTLDNLSQNEKLSIYPVVNSHLIAIEIHNAGYQVYADASSYDSAKQKLSSFYEGVIIRNKEISASEVADLQKNGKKVILHDMFSEKGLKEAFRKHPDVLFAEDFKAAIIQRN